MSNDVKFFETPCVIEPSSAQVFHQSLLPMSVAKCFANHYYLLTDMLKNFALAFSLYSFFKPCYKTN